MILVYYPKLEKQNYRHQDDKSKKLHQLIHKVDALRSSYNYQLSTLRDEYYPKISDVICEIQRLT